MEKFSNLQHETIYTGSGIDRQPFMPMRFFVWFPDFGSRAWLQVASQVAPMKVRGVNLNCLVRFSRVFWRFYLHDWCGLLLLEQQEIFLQECATNKTHVMSKFNLKLRALLQNFDQVVEHTTRIVLLRETVRRTSSSPTARARGNLA